MAQGEKDSVTEAIEVPVQFGEVLLLHSSGFDTLREKGFRLTIGREQLQINPLPRQANAPGMSRTIRTRDTQAVTAVMTPYRN